MSNLIKQNLILIKEKGHNIEIDPELVTLAITAINILDKKYVIEAFINNSKNLWNEFKKKNEEFFIENANVIFKNFPSSNVDPFKILFRSKDNDGNLILTQETKENIWKFFDGFIKISIKYIHQERLPKNVDGKIIYQRSFHDDVDLVKEAQIWGIKENIFV